MPPKGWKGKYQKTRNASEFLQKKGLNIVKIAYQLCSDAMNDPKVPTYTKFQMISQLLPYSVPRLHQTKAIIGTTKAQELYDTLLELQERPIAALPKGGNGDAPEIGQITEGDFREYTGTDPQWLPIQTGSGDSLREGGNEEEREEEVNADLLLPSDGPGSNGGEPTIDWPIP